MSEQPVDRGVGSPEPAPSVWAPPGSPEPAPSSAPGGPSPAYPVSGAEPPPYPVSSPGPLPYPASGPGAPGMSPYPVSGAEPPPLRAASYQPGAGYPPYQPQPYQPPPPAQVTPGQQLPVRGYGAPAFNGYPGYGPPPAPAYGPYPGYGPPPPPAPAPQPNAAVMRVDSIEGTQFGVAYPAVPPTPSGTSIASMVAGIVSILVSFVVGCFGLTGSTEGWGPAVSGAFAVLAAFIGAGAIGAGLTGLRQIRRSGGTVRGRGLALAGISCGGSGLGLTVLFFLGAVALTAGS